MIDDPETRELLSNVGKGLEVLDDVRADTKAFVLSKIYAECIGVTCGRARAFNWHKLKKKGTIRLLPDDDTLDQHVKRTNYITHCQIHYDCLEHPSPIGHGREILNGKYRPVRHTLPSLPQPLTSVDWSEYTSDESSGDEVSEFGESSDSDVG